MRDGINWQHGMHINWILCICSFFFVFFEVVMFSTANKPYFATKATLLLIQINVLKLEHKIYRLCESYTNCRSAQKKYKFTEYICNVRMYAKTLTAY